MGNFYRRDLRTDKPKGTNLPHWHQEEVWVFLTFSLADALPAVVWQKTEAARVEWLAARGIDAKDDGWQAAVDRLPVSLSQSVHRRFNRDLMEALDRGHGRCELAQPEFAAAVASTLLHGDGVRYRLDDFVVMPNHVHVLFCPHAGERAVRLATGWKSFSAKRIREQCPGEGRFWRGESFDHLVRSERQLERLRAYIAENPRGLATGTFLHHVAERDAA